MWRSVAGALVGLGLVAQGPAAAGTSAANPWVADRQAWRSAVNQVQSLTAAQRALVSQLTAEASALAATRRALAAATERWAASRRLAVVLAQDEASLERQRGATVARTVAILRVVEWMGPTTFLGVILGAHRWSGFIHRAGAVAATLALIRRQLTTLERQSRVLHQDLSRQKRLQSLLARERTDLQRLAQRQAAALAGYHKTLDQLGRRQAFYLHAVAVAEAAATELVRPELAALQAAISQALVQNPGALSVSINPGPTAHTVRVSITESALDQWLATALPNSPWRFQLDPVGSTLQFPPGAVAIAGVFAPTRTGALVFRFTSVTFGGLSLPLALLGTGSAQHQLAVDVGALLPGAAVTGVAVEPGTLTLTVRIPGTGLLD
ncbi:MAG: hypothetical protein K6U14_11360 [Firmicutes bacterium]|nr:hypothetical protein [Alicyclobacillaceae bacterium]MCL6498211.1 hypothetical protein [Bacillota bacterium]